MMRRIPMLLLVLALPSTTLARTVSATTGAIIGRVSDSTGGVLNPMFRAEPIDAHRTRNMTVLDVRAEKASSSSGTSYLRPLDIIAPRVARLGLTFDW